MTRRSCIFVLVSLLLAACATTTPKPLVVEDDSAVVYLVGKTTRYSVSMDELKPNGSAHRRNRLPNALVAGDQSLTVAASLFHSGDIYTLDLIIKNHGDHPIEIDRSRLELMDDEGRHFDALYDWEEGIYYGLRSIRELNRGYAHLGTDFEESGHGGEDTRSQKPPPKKTIHEKLDAAAATRMGENASLNDFSWISELEMEDETVVLPETLELYAGQNRPYWAYWRAKEPEFPMTAIVVVDGKRMLFRFDEN